MHLPPALVQSLQSIKGFDPEAFVQVHATPSPITSIRFNPNKVSVDKIESLSGGNLNTPVPWCRNGYYLNERPSFTLDPLFHAGAYYVQEASSMFLEEALKQVVDLDQPLRVLDLCAAPGGKSTLVQSLISKQSLLVSNEIIKMRVNILAENMIKWGAENVVVTNNDPRDFKRLPNYFDVIIVDAPCSGSGLFRKDPNAIKEWSEQNVQLCSQRQQRILADIIPSLKDNGILIYSTCSYSSEEDETIADWLLGQVNMSTISLQIPADWGIIETSSPRHNANGYRFYPDKVKGEGFYLAVFCKNAGNNISPATGKIAAPKKRSILLSPAEMANLHDFVQNKADYFYIRQNEEVIAVPNHLERDLPVIQSALYIKKAGVKLGQLIRNELIPDHELALSTLLSGGMRVYDVDLQTALQYLRRQEITVEGLGKGWTLITYQHLALGWIKVLPNRVNNYYPKDWRILHK